MKKNCNVCGEGIDIKQEKYVLLGTYNGTGKAKKNEDYFHFKCWIDWYNSQVAEKVTTAQKKAMSVLQRIIPNFNLPDFKVERS